MMTETWKPVVGFEDYYEVSNCGRVRSLNRVVTRNGHQMTCKGQMLTPAMYGGAHSYPGVILYKDGKRKNVFVHRLVALAFLGAPPQGQQNVLHGDGNRMNNHVSNLRWGSHTENMADAIEHGAVKLPRRRLSLAQFIGIYYGTHTLKEAGKVFGVHPVTCCNVRNGRTKFPPMGRAA